MNKILILLLIFATPTFANAGAIKFTEAKLNADRSEAYLAPAQLNHLVETQGKLAGTAFPAYRDEGSGLNHDRGIVVKGAERGW